MAACCRTPNTTNEAQLIYSVMATPCLATTSCHHSTPDRSPALPRPLYLTSLLCPRRPTHQPQRLEHKRRLPCTVQQLMQIPVPSPVSLPTKIDRCPRRCRSRRCFRVCHQMLPKPSSDAASSVSRCCQNHHLMLPGLSANVAQNILRRQMFP